MLSNAQNPTTQHFLGRRRGGLLRSPDRIHHNFKVRKAWAPLPARYAASLTLLPHTDPITAPQARDLGRGVPELPGVGSELIFKLLVRLNAGDFGRLEECE